MQSSTVDASYLMVSDSQKRIHFFQNGSLVTTLHVPSVVTSMSSGYFVSNSNNSDQDLNNPATTNTTSTTTMTTSPSKSQRISCDQQVAMATKSGAVFIFSNFVVLPYANLLYPITGIRRLPAMGSDDLDAILCCGHFNKLCILQNRKVVTSYETNDWVDSIDIIERTNSSDAQLIVLGSLDNSVKLLKIRKSR